MSNASAITVTDLVAQPVTRIIGPLETARFLQDDGTINVKFTPPASTTLNVAIRCYRLPRYA